LTPKKNFFFFFFFVSSYLSVFSVFFATNQNETFTSLLPYRRKEVKKRDWKWKATCLEKSELRSTFPKVEIKAKKEKFQKKKITTGEAKVKFENYLKKTFQAKMTQFVTTTALRKSINFSMR
jgi:hypothetical protein